MDRWHFLLRPCWPAPGSIVNRVTAELSPAGGAACASSQAPRAIVLEPQGRLVLSIGYPTARRWSVELCRATTRLALQMRYE